MIPALALVAAWQGLIWMGEGAERQGRYEEALAFARSTGKPLLVVGGPFGSVIRASLGQARHGYGDYCMDLDPSACRGAPPGCTVVRADVRSIPYGDGYFGAAFVSHVLEHLASVEECARAVAELRRVAGRVYVVSPSGQSLMGAVHWEHRLWIEQLPDGTVSIEDRSGPAYSRRKARI